MEIIHPDMEYVPVKINRAKLDSDGNVVYIVEECELPKVVLDALSDKKSESEDEE